MADGSNTNANEDDVEQLLLEAIEGEDGGTDNQNHLREVIFGISQTTGLSSLAYNELNDDTLLMASEWNLLTEDFADDEEEVLVVSTPVQEESESTNRLQLLPPPPLISSEDDDSSGRSEHKVKVNSSTSMAHPHPQLIPANFRLDSEDYDEEVVVKVVDEVEASRRYLTIHSAPMYRWSEGMLPSISIPNEGIGGCNGGDDQQKDTGDKSPEEEVEDEKKMLLESVHNGPSIPAFDEKGPVKVPPPSSIRSPWIAERLRHLAKAYNDRTSFVKKELANYSDSEDSDDSSEGGGNFAEDTDGEEKRAAAERKRREHFTFESIFGDEWDKSCPGSSQLLLEEKVAAIRLQRESSSSWISTTVTNILVLHAHLSSVLFSRTFEPASQLNVLWLALLATAFAYNATCILFRAVFHNSSSEQAFFILDLAFDLLYLLDVVWFKPRLRFVEAGQWMDEAQTTRAHYRRSRCFKIDLLSIFPLDFLLWAYLGDYHHPRLWPLQRLSRLNRFLKVDAFWAFFARIDALSTRYAYVFRIVHTLCYKAYIIHLGACSYYLVSRLKGFRSTPWTYDDSVEGNAYLRCFYFAFRTTTSIGGRLPKPTTPFERVYMTVAWLLGVFVFAMVLGQIRDIVANAARDADHYRAVLDQSAAYMRRMGVPAYVQARVRSWLNATWALQKTFNEGAILEVLPLKSRTDIALSVHLATLSRVELFRNIDRNVLRDLVLKLRPILFLPDDYVCRRGDVGHEMYIVDKGRIQVLGGENGSVLITLGEGSVFGEIAILNLEGFTRRTADVRSVGYSQLFALTKADLWETLKNYPEYQAVLKRKVQRILRKKRAAQQHQQQQQRASRRRRHKAKGSRQATLEEKEEVEVFQKPGDQIALQMPLIVPKVEVNVEVEDDQDQIGQLKYENEGEEGDGDDEDDDDDEVFDVAGACIEVESILKERPRTPKLFDAVMEAVRPDSKVKGYFSRSQSIASTTYQGGPNSFSLDESAGAGEDVKIKVESEEEISGFE